MYHNLGINRAFLVGRIEEDALWAVSKEGEEILRFSLITTELYLKNGEKVIHTEQHKIAIPKRITQTGKTLFLKGLLISIEGKIQTNSRFDSANVKRYEVEILATKYKCLL